VRLLPEGSTWRVEKEAPKIVRKFRDALIWSRDKERVIELDPKAREIWRRFYSQVEIEGDDESELLTAIRARAAANTRRIALIYAALDKSTKVKPVHVRAAIEIWRYSEASAQFLWGEFDPIGIPRRASDAIREEAADCPGGWVSRARLNKRFSNQGLRAFHLDAALEDLRKRGLAERRTLPTKGRRKTEWRLRE
jgi:hypothetical protein